MIKIHYPSLKWNEYWYICIWKYNIQYSFILKCECWLQSEGQLFGQPGNPGYLLILAIKKYSYLQTSVYQRGHYKRSAFLESLHFISTITYVCLWVTLNTASVWFMIYVCCGFWLFHLWIYDWRHCKRCIDLMKGWCWASVVNKSGSPQKNGKNWRSKLGLATAVLQIFLKVTRNRQNGWLVETYPYKSCW